MTDSPHPVQSPMTARRSELQRNRVLYGKRWCEMIQGNAGMLGNAVFGALLLTIGCSGRVIDVGAAGSGGSITSSVGGGAGLSEAAGGANNDGMANTCQVNTPLPVWPNVEDCQTDSNLPIIGSWHGYVGNQDAPWDAMTLEIHSASVDGGVCGTLTIGEGNPPTPDRAHGYYPGTVQSDTVLTPYPVPGFKLTLFDGTTDGKRVRFSVRLAEAWREWCQLQTSYAVGSDGSVCRCLPGNGATYNPDGTCELSGGARPTSAFDCGTVQLCVGPPFSVCSCSAAGCEADTGSGSVDFDLRFVDDNDVEGSGTASNFVNAAVFFSRAP